MAVQRGEGAVLIKFMRTKLCGAIAVFVAVISWVWLMIALPSFSGFSGPDAIVAKQSIGIVFTILSVTTFVMGVLLFRSKTL